MYIYTLENHIHRLQGGISMHMDCYFSIVQIASAYSCDLLLHRNRTPCPKAQEKHTPTSELGG